MEGHCVCPFSGCSFIGTYHELYAHASSGHSDDLQMIECGETMSISFANHQRVVLKEQSRRGGKLISVNRLIQPIGAFFHVRCISPNVLGMGNFSSKLTVKWSMLSKHCLLRFKGYDGKLRLGDILEKAKALPKYPLTPIHSNKRKLIAIRRKSKKSKKVASNRQENIADGETEEQEQSDDV
ncbi:unnamed protein product [Eruca vesicaria subsp. sativa]|uniref:Uncharacterized protein n=1 Tax=Eruca vesicaria subsp. sativa TaxID=29727 RepID=A0ABC8JFF9_ERUVS|nr:unnamed protein product [Eruca vesicaria subsp. sativa]